MDPAETHWQGPRIAAAASLHRKAAGQRDSGRLESGQCSRCEETRSQSSGSRGDALVRAQDSRRSYSARSCCGAGRLESGQSTRAEGTHAGRAMDPAETHWQGHWTAAAASQHKAAAGVRDSGRLESGQCSRCEGTRSQSSGSRGDALARALDSRRS